MSYKRMIANVCICFTLIGLFSGCGASQSGVIGTMLATTPSQSVKTATILVHPATPQLITPTSIPTITSTPYPLEGEIYFLVNENVINAVNVASGTTREIRNNQALTIDPIPVPSGHLFYLFGSLSQDQFQVYRMNLDGSDAKRLAYDAYNDLIMAVSQDGSRIAYVQHPTSGGDNFYLSVIDFRKGGLTAEVFSSTESIVGLSWSNNGEKLAFYLWNPDFRINDQGIYGDLYVMDANGTNRTQIKSDLPIVYDPPAWSPDDRQVAISAYDKKGVNLYLIDVNSGALKKLTDTSMEVRYPIWSPSGDKILFMQGSSYIVISPDGTNQKVLGDQAPDFAPYKDAAWSPDGHYVAMNQNQSLVIVNADSGTSLQLFSPPGADNIDSLSWINTTQP